MDLNIVFHKIFSSFCSVSLVRLVTIFLNV